MKNNIILIMAIAINFTTYSQDCKYSKDEVDSFTKTKKVLTTQDMLYKDSRDRIKIATAKIDNTSLLYFTIITTVSKSYGYLYKDYKIFIKADTTILELIISSSNYGETIGDYTTYTTYIVLDNDTKDFLTKNQIDEMRIYWSKGYQDYSILNKDIISKQLNCIINK